MRGTGTTTKQMKEAKRGAIFVWCNGDTWYPKDLARQHGRQDLKILPLSVLDDDARLAGNTGVVLDHAAWDQMTERQRDVWRLLDRK